MIGQTSAEIAARLSPAQVACVKRLAAGWDGVTGHPSPVVLAGNFRKSTRALRMVAQPVVEFDGNEARLTDFGERVALARRNHR